MTHQNPISSIAALAIAVSALMLAQPATASVFTYQGQLAESGSPVAGPVDLAFRLYDGAAGGMQIGPEVAFDNFDNFADGGEFTVALDFGSGAFPGEDRWLEIWVNGTPLSPRQPVRPSPYAIHAQIVSDGALPVPYASMVNFSSAGNDFNGSFSGSGAGLASLNASNLSTGIVGGDRLAGTYVNALTLPNAGNSFTGDGGGLMNIDWDSLVNVPAGFADGVDDTSNVWSMNGDDVYYDAGNVGIGTSSPNAMLTVGSGDGAALHVGQQPQLNLMKDTVDNKFRIQLTGTGYGGYDLQIGRDNGAHDIVFSGDVGIGTDNPTYPLHAVADSNADFAVFGEHSNVGAGLAGLASSSSGLAVGVLGVSRSTGGSGVEGVATAKSGVTCGVCARSDSSNGIAVSALVQDPGGPTYGVESITYSTSGTGVFGNAIAVSGVTYGVRGQASSPDGFGVFSGGELGASGTKSFVIDHPFDPENKYLKHYASEGPEPLNIYRGRVTLDGLGQARIKLPEYFEAINRDPLYTLTPIGAAMPNLHVADEVLNNEFRIAGGAPGMDVSWRVEGVRNDPYVRSRGAPVEVAKGENERGLYQYPEFYDQPPERGINYVQMNQ